LRFSITTKESILDWILYLQLFLIDGFMKNNWQHKMCGVHY